MPTVAKQSPKVTSRAVAGPARGSILSQAVPIEDLEEDPIHLLLYGKNRLGKTTLACQFPKPLLLVSVEPTKSGGARSVKKIDGVSHIRLTESEKVQKLGVELRGDTGGYQTVVVDSGTSLDEMVLAEVCGWTETAEMLRWGRVTRDQYTERSERIRKVLRPYLELPCHVVIVCNEKDHNPPEGQKSALTKGIQTESFFAAAMSGGTTRWVQDGCDYVCQLYMEKETRTVTSKVGAKEVAREEETGKFVRRLRTSYHPNFASGFRSENPGSVPEYIEAVTPQEMYEKFMVVVRGE